MFRYPAKFHPPVARALVDAYCEPGGLVLDPFCGSGTLLVEAAARDRNSIGVDVDPLAVAVTNAKVHRHHSAKLRASARRLSDALAPQRRSVDEYELRMFEDLSDRAFKRQLASLAPWIPEIPNLHHWFRRYVIIDLARIRRTLSELSIPDTHRAFLAVVFASIIRNASNADPVPVSGLEVTKWMRSKEAAGRLVNPFDLLEKALSRSLDAAEEFANSTSANVVASAFQSDATTLRLRRRRSIDAVITSPPYHGAVDYYRRHQLEMFWLGLTDSQEQRVALLQHYIGRPHVPPRHPWLSDPLPTALAKEWETHIREISRERANEFRHYLTAMTSVFRSLAPLLQPAAPAVFVVGHSSWNSAEIPTTQLFTEIAGSEFEFDEVLSYEVKNRYMSYERHNAANIATEYVLVLRRTTVAANS
jgi:16S rRNA G966 N2-methylase RsmD